jgi:hypothetical protein
LNRQKIVDSLRQYDSKNMQLIFHSVVTLFQLAVSSFDSRQASPVVVVSIAQDSNAMDVVDNDGPAFESYFYCLEICLQLIGATIGATHQKNFEGIEQILSFLPEQYAMRGKFVYW